METKRARTAAFVGTVILMGAVAAGADGAGNPAGVVAALAGKPPQVLSELEAAVGPLHRDPAKWADAVGPLYRVSPRPGVARATVELAIDPFHQDPPKVADPALRHWDLDFLSGREACQRLLAARFPRPLELRVDNRRILRFGDLYLTDLDVDGGFRLSWYDREPLFAIPLRNASETAKLVEDLAAVANAGFTRQAVVARLGALTPDPGHAADVLRTETWELFYEPMGAAKPQRLTISFKRPLPARELLPKLGILRPAVRSGDTHLQSRYIFDRAKRVSFETGYPLPAVGGYAVRLGVDPKGLIETRERSAGSPAWSADGAQILSLEALTPWLDPKQKRL
ncbi:MAG: hypothetical protein ACJ76N_25520 [Thermoanaerobaculia bacterium]